MKKPTVAIIGTKGYPFVYSGYDTLVTHLVEWLAHKYELHVYAHRSLFRERPPLLHGARIHYLPAIETRRLSHLSHGLLSTLHAAWKSYDLYFFVNSCHGPFGYLLGGRKARTIINTDGLEWLRPQFRGLVATYYYWSSRLCTRTFGTLVTDCQVMSDVYRKEFGAVSEVIAYGGDILENGGETAENPLGLERGSYYLNVGRLIPDNNSSLLIEGFLRARTDRTLVIVGDVLFPDRFAESMKKKVSDRVLFTGFVKDPAKLRALYRDAFAYLHGHQSGGTSPALLGALGAGCCVLALDTPFSRETLAEGRCGLFFTCSPDSVAQAIHEVEHKMELVESLRQRAVDRIREAFTWERIAGQYDSVFQRALIAAQAREPRGVSARTLSSPAAP